MVNTENKISGSPDSLD